jgi:hypothetical protein
MCDRISSADSRREMRERMRFGLVCGDITGLWDGDLGGETMASWEPALLAALAVGARLLVQAVLAAVPPLTIAELGKIAKIEVQRRAMTKG